MSDQQLTALLDHLSVKGQHAGWWQGWHIRHIIGGANNLLYRATGVSDFAIKWTLRDDRDRAGREYAALEALQQAGLTIAPLPVLLDRERYAQPVVVQTWLSGDVVAPPPETEEAWWALVRHYVAIHTLSLDRTSVSLPSAVLNMDSAASGLKRIDEQLAFLPESARPAALEALVERVKEIHFPTWMSPALRLCRSDPNTLNLIRRPGAWASVDWENSGWGDPAFEIADMMAHPAYLVVPPDRWQWVVAAYCDMHSDTTIGTRIRVYHALALVWWVARLVRTLYEVPQGRDQRLVERPAGWQADVQPKYDRYLELANRALMRYE